MLARDSLTRMQRDMRKGKVEKFPTYRNEFCETDVLRGGARIISRVARSWEVRKTSLGLCGLRESMYACFSSLSFTRLGKV